jgi:NTE family protein
MKDVLVHMIADDAVMTRLSARSKVNATPLLLHELRAAGHAAADRFLAGDGAQIGQRATVDPARLCN